MSRFDLPAQNRALLRFAVKAVACVVIVAVGLLLNQCGIIHLSPVKAGAKNEVGR